MWLQRRQAKKMAEIERKIANGEINPLEMFGMGGGLPGMGYPPPVPPHPTTSGTVDGAQITPGQYI
jgi:hypothetical protein